MYNESRRDSINKKHYLRNIFIILSGIIIIVVIFFFFGIPLLINFSILVGNLRVGNDSEKSVHDTTYLAPPILFPIQDATGSARIDISGTAISGQTIKLYLNGKYIKETGVFENNNFTFDNILLDEGNNDIKATSIGTGGKESDYSKELHIVYKNKPPDLEVKSPQDKQTISGTSQIKVDGKTNSDVRVTVNNYWAIVDNMGNFSYLLNLQKGENKIKITAVDAAGNQSSKDLTVTLNQ